MNGTMNTTINKFDMKKYIVVRLATAGEQREGFLMLFSVPSYPSIVFQTDYFEDAMNYAKVMEHNDPDKAKFFVCNVLDLYENDRNELL